MSLYYPEKMSIPNYLELKSQSLVWDICHVLNRGARDVSPMRQRDTGFTEKDFRSNFETDALTLATYRDW